MNAGIQKRESFCVTERSLRVDQASAHTKSVAMAPCRDKIERDSVEREDTNTRRSYRLERDSDNKTGNRRRGGRSRDVATPEEFDDRTRENVSITAEICEKTSRCNNIDDWSEQKHAEIE
jgi:hypothetical protein